MLLWIFVQANVSVRGWCRRKMEKKQGYGVSSLRTEALEPKVSIKMERKMEYLKNTMKTESW